MNSETPLKLRLAKLIGSEKPFVWAKRIGLSAATFNRVWNERGQLKSDSLSLIAEKTGVSLSWLVAGKEPMYFDAAMQSRELPHDAAEGAYPYRLDIKPILDAAAEVLTSDDEGTKLALSQNVFTFQKTVRFGKEISELRRDMDIIKKRLLSSDDKDFKTQESKGKKHQAGGGNGK